MTTTTNLVVRIIAGVVSAPLGALWAWMAFMVFNVRFDTSPGTDPHGYGLIFGTMFATVIGFVFIAIVPFAFPRKRWGVVGLVAGVSYVVVTAALFTAWFSA